MGKLKRIISYVVIFSLILATPIKVQAINNGSSYSNAYLISSKKISSSQKKITSTTRRFSKGSTIWYKFTTGDRGEYNIYSNGNMNTYATLYTKSFLKLKSISSDDNSGVGNNFRIQKGLNAKTTYYLAVTAKNTGCVTISVEANQDKYTGRKLTISTGGSWVPLNYSYQPYTNQCITKVTWLNDKQACIYSANLADNKYLRMLNTGMQLSVILTTAGISKTSSLGKKIMAMGSTTVASVIKTIADSWGGISFVPNLISISQKAVEQKTKNYTKGLKITTMTSYYYGTVNAYDAWDMRKNSIEGPYLCRGKFKPGDIQVGGW